MKRVKNNDIEDITELSYDEVSTIFNIKNVGATTTGYTVPPGNYENRNVEPILESPLPSDVKVFTTADFIRTNKHLTLNDTTKLYEETSIYLILGSTTGPLMVLSKKYPEKQKKPEPINIRGIEKLQI